jgi:hypothetical protein
LAKNQRWRPFWRRFEKLLCENNVSFPRRSLGEDGTIEKKSEMEILLSAVDQIMT